jgi:uroporphyrinogen-III synthase
VTAVTSDVRVGVFRPDDGRLADAVELLDSLGATPVPDPMLAVDSTGVTPDPADYVVFTSRVAARVLAEAGYDPGEATVCAIGASTAGALRDAGYTVDLVPEEYSSAGLVAALDDRVAGRTVEVARSDHGSDVLLDGLRAAGADVHETVLYRLVRPAGAGDSCERAAAGELEAALFTSSMMVANWVAAAADRGVRTAALDGLDAGVVGAIGDPTRETLADYGVTADVVPERADFELLATEVVEAAAPTYHD